ncbi:histidine kinase dimerization/phospho-acceptor domain-containing protein, partial [Ursidibacter maritimus]|uniref:histidine kinase dimerization/phospho-acceptor domain-containing protein n=1 Tax=Ursidibacter maritimus TaxID=1331689 RepID=UPI0027BAD19D
MAAGENGKGMVVSSDRGEQTWITADGQFQGLVGISIDVEEAVEAEEALKTADHRKDEFLATLAHELRNPLAPISNALQFLRYPEGKRRAD